MASDGIGKGPLILSTYIGPCSIDKAVEVINNLLGELAEELPGNVSTDYYYGTDYTKDPKTSVPDLNRCTLKFRPASKELAYACLNKDIYGDPIEIDVPDVLWYTLPYDIDGLLNFIGLSSLEELEEINESTRWADIYDEDCIPVSPERPMIRGNPGYKHLTIPMTLEESYKLPGPNDPNFDKDYGKTEYHTIIKQRDAFLPTPSQSKTVVIVRNILGFNPLTTSRQDVIDHYRGLSSVRGYPKISETAEGNFRFEYGSEHDAVLAYNIKYPGTTGSYASLAPTTYVCRPRTRGEYSARGSSKALPRRR